MLSVPRSVHACKLSTAQPIVNQGSRLAPVKATLARRSCRRAVQALAMAQTPSGPVYLVTGAGRGLGLTMVKHILMSSKDSTVIATARNLQGQQSLQDLADLADQGGQKRLQLVQLDMSDSSSIQAAAAWVQDNVGRLDVLINNAGVVEKELASWEKTDPKEAHNILVTNTLGPLLLTQALVPVMRKTQNGRKLIAHVSSLAGSLSSVSTELKRRLEQAASGAAAKGGPYSLPGFQAVGGAYVVYRASKAALNMEMLIMARDLHSEGFTVVSLHPGFVATDLGNASARDMNQLNRSGSGQQQDGGAPPGVQPPLSPEDSVKGLMGVLQKVTPADTGKFLAWDGSEVAF